MRRVTKIMVGLAVAVLASGPVSAHVSPLGAGPMVSPREYPGAPKPVHDEGMTSPYAMNYTDEAAQTLGFRDGHTDVFTVKPRANQSYLPTFSGGLGGDGAMLKLQWRPGQ